MALPFAFGLSSEYSTEYSEYSPNIPIFNRRKYTGNLIRGLPQDNYQKVEECYCKRKKKISWEFFSCCVCRFTARNLNNVEIFICSAIEPKAPRQQLPFGQFDQRFYLRV